MAKTNEPLVYYRWYWRDWRGSRAVQRMTPIQRGIYRELLDEQWKSGAIKNDMAWMAEAAMCSVEEMTDAWRTLRSQFVEVPGSEGHLYINERLESERTETDAKRTKAAIAGRLGGIAKQSLANAEQSPSERHIAVAGAVSEQSKSSSNPSSSVGLADASPDGARPKPPEEPDWRQVVMMAEKGITPPRITRAPE